MDDPEYDTKSQIRSLSLWLSFIIIIIIIIICEFFTLEFSLGGGSFSGIWVTSSLLINPGLYWVLLLNSTFL